MQLELNRRVLGAEASHHLGDHARADALVRPDAQGPRLAGPERRHVRTRCIEPGDDGLRVTQQELAGVGKRYGARAAWPFDEPLADDPLERPDLLADRRLGVAEPFGGTAKRLFAGDSLEGGEVAEFHAKPCIRLSDRCHEILDLP